MWYVAEDGMYLTFPSGRTYLYRTVGSDMYAALVRAEGDRGRYFNQYIRPLHRGEETVAWWLETGFGSGSVISHVSNQPADYEVGGEG
jgi:hypothetical protein